MISKTILRLSLLACLHCLLMIVDAQEICDNAIDDDQDGWIDLQDSDCDCPSTLPSSLIPNASFEDTVCCPRSLEALFCADTWQQASAPTTDFLHTCGFRQHPDIPVPLPLPDGNGYVGFRNGAAAPRNNPNWKEYVGACLPTALQEGKAYRLQFHLGFSDADHSPPLNISLFGTSNCRRLPFGNFDERYGCPLNGTGWTLLDSMTLSGRNNWVQGAFEFTPDTNIAAIVIGPDCFDGHFLFRGPYYFLDQLILAERNQFTGIITASGMPCDPGFTLEVEAADTVSLQWYRDSIAIVGATGATLRGDLVSGSYQVRISGSRFCRVTSPYRLDIPTANGSADLTLCPNDSL